MLAGELKPLVPRRHFYAGKKSIIEHVCFISFQDKKRTVLTVDTLNHIFYNIFWLTKTTFFHICYGKTGLKLIKSYISNIFQMIWLRVHNKVCLVKKI